MSALAQRNAVARHYTRRLFTGEVAEVLAERGHSATQQHHEWDNHEWNETAERLLTLPHKLALAVALYMRLHGIDQHLGTANTARLEHLAGGFQPKHEGQIAVAVLGLASTATERQKLMESLLDALRAEGIPAAALTPRQAVPSVFECPWCSKRYDETDGPLWPSMVRFVARQTARGKDVREVFAAFESAADARQQAHMRQSSTYRVRKSLLIRCVRAQIALVNSRRPRGKTDLERELSRVPHA